MSAVRSTSGKWPWVVLGASLAVTLLFWRSFEAEVVARERAELDRQAEQAVTVVQRWVHQREIILRGARGLLVSSHQVNRSKWQAYASAVLPGHMADTVLGLGYIEWVAASRASEFLQQTRADGSLDFAFTPSGDRDSYCVVKYMTPGDFHPLSAGMDVAVRPCWPEALDLARDTGEIVTIPPFESGGEPRKPIMLLAVYRHGCPQETVEERRAALKGWVFMPLAVGKLAYTVCQGIRPQGISLRVWAGEYRDRQVNGRRISSGQGSNDPPAHVLHRIVQAGGAIWHVELMVPSSFVRPNRAVAGVLLATGLLASLFLFVALRSWLSARNALALAEETNARLQATYEAVDTAARAKSEFLTNVSHEIRSPMTAVVGFAENLLDPGLADSDRWEAIQAIRRNAEHLLGVVNDILDMSKIEANRLQIELIECSPCAILGDIAAMMRTRAKDKGLHFAIEYVGPMPTAIRTEPTRLRQILVNLVGNAIKFTESGGVRVVARCIPDYRVTNGVAEGVLQLDVVDTGIGMTADQLSRLFQPFVQADASVARRFGGTGLGLVISRKLCEALNGSITVESEPGHGSTFRVILPAGSLEGVQMIEWPDELPVTSPLGTDWTPERLLANVRILLAEDGPDNQRLLSFVLRKAGAEVTLADNGQAAIKLALAALDRDEPFAVVLMDMQMPVLDGYTAVSLLRHKGYTGPIVALTAHAMSGDRERCLAIGCTEYLTKPVPREKLVQTVHRTVMASACVAQPVV